MNCIDLYSGIGGWTLGMKLAGVRHVASFEWNQESNETHNQNFGTDTAETDIRNLSLTDLPRPGEVDIVVGSPPCTQFSYSNRGGKGNIEDGLVDVFKFLTVVEYLRPKYWAMENVPRVKGIIEKLVSEHPRFTRFAPLITFNEVVNCWEFGTPQKRKRMICGNFPGELFMSYRDQCPRYTMGEALQQLTSRTRNDLLFGWPKGRVLDNDTEAFLTEEEIRINREAKVHHPVYNKMSFPDPLDRPSRTVTSLCTRVSRESIVIEAEGGYRRLSVRERAVLMGFPVNYQFYGRSYGAKLKMIGNAIPPPLTYQLFCAMQEREYTPLKKQANYRHAIPKQAVPETPAPVPKQKYGNARSFRFCVPGFRYGSGVRFELSNTGGEWKVRFFYGSSKRIYELPLDERLEVKLRTKFPQKCFPRLPQALRGVTGENLQDGWVGLDGLHPFNAIDLLGEYGEAVRKSLPKRKIDDELLSELFHERPNRSVHDEPGKAVAGAIIGVLFNKELMGMNYRENCA